MKLKEIRERYRKIHDTLTVAYYVDKSLTKEEFDARHGRCWSDMRAELIEGGHVEPRPDYGAEWRAATTPAEKLKVLGRMCGWE